MKLPNLHFIGLILAIVLILDNHTFAQQQQIKTGIFDGWQRWLQIGGFTATLIAAGCGTDLLNRRLGDVETRNTYKNISIHSHRNVHAFAGAAAFGLYLSSGWELYKINQKRKTLQFRHKAHNALFLSTVAGLITSGTLGFFSSSAYRNGKDADGQNYAEAMQTVGMATLALGFADIVLFGRHDNASIIGIKIRF